MTDKAYTKEEKLQAVMEHKFGRPEQPEPETSPALILWMAAGMVLFLICGVLAWVML